MNRENRIFWVDITKGILIILIVLGHVFKDGIIRMCIFSFHVPAFFFLSGYCYKKYPNKEFLARKLKTIVVPYIVFSILSIAIVYCASFLKPSLCNILDCGIISNLKVMLYGNSKPDVMKYNQPLWFLTCFFCTNIVCHMIIRLNKKYLLYAFMFVCVLLGAFFCHFKNIKLPWHFETSISMNVWYLIGYIYRSKNIIERLKKNNKRFLFPIFLIIMGIIFSFFNTRVVGVRNEHYGILLVYYVSAFCTINGLIILAMEIKRCPLLEGIGINTIGILVLHKFPILFFQEIVGTTKNLLSKPNSLQGLVLGMGLSFAIVLLCYYLSMVIKSYCPIVFGYSKNRR